MDGVSSVQSGTTPALFSLPDPPGLSNPSDAGVDTQAAPVAAPRSPAQTPGNMISTSAEISIDPATHAIIVTVRDAGTNEVLLHWPIATLVEAAPHKGYPPVLVVQTTG
jgi:hypothetical protein